MKAKLLALLIAITVCFTCALQGGVDVHAEEAGEEIDLPYLLTDDALVGYAALTARGVYLAEGYSIINKISSSTIGAGGITNAAVKCTVTVTSIVERKNDSGSWVRVTSWTKTNENAFSAGISRSLTVGTGYYYRVRSYHYASSDSSTSNTAALWIGN